MTNYFTDCFYLWPVGKTITYLQLGLKVDATWVILNVVMTSYYENVCSCKRHSILSYVLFLVIHFALSWPRNSLLWVLISTVSCECLACLFYSSINAAQVLKVCRTPGPVLYSLSWNLLPDQLTVTYLRTPFLNWFTLHVIICVCILLLNTNYKLNCEVCRPSSPIGHSSAQQ